MCKCVHPRVAKWFEHLHVYNRITPKAKLIYRLGLSTFMTSQFPIPNMVEDLAMLEVTLYEG